MVFVDACWAIAAVAATEAKLRVTYPEGYDLEPLSVQQVLDCARGDHCGGGSEIDAYAYMIKRLNLMNSAQSYPYKGRNDTYEKDR